MKPNGKFSLILDALTAFAIVAIVLVSVATSALSLIFRPDREPWRVALDVVIVVVFIALVIIATKVLRRVLKTIDAEEAEAADKARVHSDHAENVTLPRLRKRIAEAEHVD